MSADPKVNLSEAYLSAYKASTRVVRCLVFEDRTTGHEAARQAKSLAEAVGVVTAVTQVWTAALDAGRATPPVPPLPDEQVVW